MNLSEIYEELERIYPVVSNCPFCYGVASPNSSWSHAWVECDTKNCGGRGPKFPRLMHDPMKAFVLAIEAWEQCE